MPDNNALLTTNVPQHLPQQGADELAVNTNSSSLGTTGLGNNANENPELTHARVLAEDLIAQYDKLGFLQGARNPDQKQIAEVQAAIKNIETREQDFIAQHPEFQERFAPLRDSALRSSQLQRAQLELAARDFDSYSKGMWNSESKIRALLDKYSPVELERINQIFTQEFNESLVERSQKRQISLDLRSTIDAALKGDKGAIAAEKIFVAMNRWRGDDEAAIQTALAGLAPQDIKRTEEVFAARFASRLGYTDLRSTVSGRIGGDDLVMTQALLNNNSELFDAAKIHQAASGWSKDTESILSVLEHKTAEQLLAIEHAYKKQYGDTLASYLNLKLSSNDAQRAQALLVGDQVEKFLLTVKREGQAWYQADADAIRTEWAKLSVEQQQEARERHLQRTNHALSDDMRALRLSATDQRTLHSLIKNGTLSDLDLFIDATHRWGTKDDQLRSVLTGKSRAQINDLAAQYRKETGEDLFERARNEVSGELRFDIDLLLEGTPETVEQLLDQAKRRFEYERSGYFVKVIDFFSSTDEVMKADYKEIERLAELMKDPAQAQNVELQGELLKHASRFALASDAFRDSKNSVANTAASIAAGVVVTVVVVGATVITIVSGGVGAPLLVVAGAAAAASFAARAGTKALLKGSSYVGADVAHDGALALVDGGTVLVAGVGGRVASSLAGVSGGQAVLGRVVGGRVADAMIEGAGAAASAAGANAGSEKALYADTWKNGIVSGVVDVAQTGATAAAIAAPGGAVMGYIAAKSPLPTQHKTKVIVPAIPADKLPAGLVSVPLTIQVPVASRLAGPYIPMMSLAALPAKAITQLGDDANEQNAAKERQKETLRFPNLVVPSKDKKQKLKFDKAQDLEEQLDPEKKQKQALQNTTAGQAINSPSSTAISADISKETQVIRPRTNENVLTAVPPVIQKEARINKLAPAAIAPTAIHSELEMKPIVREVERALISSDNQNKPPKIILSRVQPARAQSISEGEKKPKSEKIASGDKIQRANRRKEGRSTKNINESLIDNLGEEALAVEITSSYDLAEQSDRVRSFDEQKVNEDPHLSRATKSESQQQSFDEIIPVTQVISDVNAQILVDQDLVPTLIATQQEEVKNDSMKQPLSEQEVASEQRANFSETQSAPLVELQSDKINIQQQDTHSDVIDQITAPIADADVKQTAIDEIERSIPESVAVRGAVARQADQIRSLAEEVAEVHEQSIIAPHLLTDVIEEMVIAEQSVTVDNVLTQGADLEQHVEPAKVVATLKTGQLHEVSGALQNIISTEQDLDQQVEAVKEAAILKTGQLDEAPEALQKTINSEQVLLAQTVKQPLFTSIAEEVTLIAENLAAKQEESKSTIAEPLTESLPEPQAELLSNTSVTIDENVHQAIQILVDAHTEDMLVTEIIQTPISEVNDQKISIENKIEQPDQYQIKPEVSINIESSEIVKETIAEPQGVREEPNPLSTTIFESSIDEAFVQRTESAVIVPAPFTQYLGEELFGINTIDPVNAATTEAANELPISFTDNVQTPFGEDISVPNSEKIAHRADQEPVPASLYQELVSAESRGNVSNDTLAQSISETPIVEYNEEEIQSITATHETIPTVISSLPEYQYSNDSNQQVVDTKELSIQERDTPPIAQQIERDREDQLSFVTDAEIRSLNHEAALTAFFAPAEISSFANYDSSLTSQGNKSNDSYSTGTKLRTQPLSVEATITNENETADLRLVLKQPVLIDTIENKAGIEIEKEVRQELTPAHRAAEAQAKSILYNTEDRRLAELSALAQIKRSRHVFDRGERIKARLALLAQEGGRLEKERLRRQMPLLRLLHPALGRREIKAQRDENLRRAQPGVLSGTR
jgi:hypothetical protein